MRRAVTAHWQAARLYRRVNLAPRFKAAIHTHDLGKALFGEELSGPDTAITVVTVDNDRSLAAVFVEEVGDRVYIREGGDGEAASIIGQRFPDQERLIRHATLEDVFLLKTGRTLRD